MPYKESLAIIREIGDRAGEANSLGSLGNVARNRGDFDAAEEYYEEALSTFKRPGQPRKTIKTLRHLVRTYDELDKDARAIEQCEQALTLIDELELGGLDQDRRWFRIRRVQLNPTPQGVTELYAAGLRRILDGEGTAAFEYLREVWDCREAFQRGTDAHTISMRAGVGFAAHLLITNSEEPDTLPESITNEIERHRIVLPDAAETLWVFVTDGEVDVDPDSLAEEENIEDEPSLDDLEAAAYATLLWLFPEEPDPIPAFGSALLSILENEAEEAIRGCLVAWHQHEDATGEEFRATLAAGVVLEAHRELGVDLPTDRDTVFELVADNRKRLTDATEALFDYLQSGAVDVTSDELRSDLEETDDEPTLEELETAAVAVLLEALRE